MKTVSLFIATVFLCLSSQAEVRGFHKLNYTAFKDSSTNYLTSYIFQNNRISFLSNETALGTIELSYELAQVLIDSNTLNKSTFESQLQRKYRFDDFKKVIFNDGKYFLAQNLDRLYITNEFSAGRLMIGRQQISFGSSTFVNPIDVFTPFSLTEIDTEERPGVDAIRYQQSIGVMGELDLGLLIGKDKQTSAAFVAIKMPSEEFEIQPIIAQYYEASLVGVDLLASFEGSNVWLELAHTSPKSSREYLRASAGANRIFTADFTGTIELHYNEAGKSSVDEYPLALGEFAFLKGGSFVVGKYYVSAAGTWQYSALTNMALSLQLNAEDTSSLIRMSLETSLSDDSVINLGLLGGVGKSSEIQGVYKSEFGAVPLTVFSQLRYYF